MEESTLGYIAGIIDGEGSIMIMRVAGKAFMEQRRKRGCYIPHYHPQIRIGMVERAPLDLIVRATSLGEVVQEKSYNNRRPMFRWNIRRRESIIKFLEMIYPYLLVKKKQAEIVIHFCKEWVSNNGFRLSDEILQKRHDAWLAVRSLNGVISPATTESRGVRGREKSAPYEATV